MKTKRSWTHAGGMRLSDERAFTGRGSLFETPYGQALMIRITVNELRHVITRVKERDCMRENAQKEGTDERQASLVFLSMKEPQEWATPYAQLREPYRKGDKEPQVEEKDDLAC